MSVLLRAVLAATLATIAVSALVGVLLLVPGLKDFVSLVLMLPLLWVSDAGINVGRNTGGFLDINAVGYLLWAAALWLVSLLLALVLRKQ